MLSSIHPLGERARRNKWWLTVGAFTLGAIAAGAVVGAAIGLAGSALLTLSGATTLWLTAAVVIAAAALDVSPLDPPGPERQVNETWIGTFRGWVYGGGFGLELGVGTLTYVVTWGVYAMYAAEFLSASPFAGALVGGVFGFGRSLTLLLAGWVDRPSRLTTFNRGLVTAGPVVRTVSNMVFVGLGILAIAVALV